MLLHYTGVQRRAPKHVLGLTWLTEEMAKLFFLSQVLCWLLGVRMERSLWQLAHVSHKGGHSWTQPMGWCQAVTGQEGSTWQRGLGEANIWMKEVSLISEKQKGRKVRNPWCHSHLTKYKHMVKGIFMFSYELIHRLHIYLKACTDSFQNKINSPPAFHFCLARVTKAGNIFTSLSSDKF